MHINKVIADAILGNQLFRIKTAVDE